MPTTRRRKQKRRTLGHHIGIASAKKADVERREWMDALKWQVVNGAVTMLIAIATVYVRARGREEIYRHVPLAVIVLYVVAMLVLTLKATWVLLEYCFGEKSPRNLKRLFFWDFITGVFIISVVVLVLSFLYDIPERISNLLGSLMPSIGQGMREKASYVITAILSGVVGNFAYDFLKQGFLRLSRRGNNRIR